MIYGFNNVTLMIRGIEYYVIDLSKFQTNEEDSNREEAPSETKKEKVSLHTENPFKPRPLNLPKSSFSPTFQALVESYSWSTLAPKLACPYFASTNSAAQ